MGPHLEFEIQSLKLKVRTLGLVEAFNIAEAYVLEQEVRVIVAHAKQLDAVDRQAFIDRQHEKLPRGQELRIKAAQLFRTPDEIPNELTVRFVQAALVGTPVPDETLLHMLETMDGDDLSKFVIMFNVILGVDKKK